MNKYLNIFSFISVAGTLAWFSTEFFGGMVIYGLMYWWLIIPITLAYGVTLIVTVSKIIQNGISKTKTSVIIHSIGLLIIASVTFFNSELLKSNVLLEAVLNDDLSAISIKLRADNTFDTEVYGMFGYVERISGEYHLEEDTVVFHKPPYTNDFLPTKVIIDRSDSAVYFNRKANGEFDRQKSFVNYFEIRKIEF